MNASNTWSGFNVVFEHREQTQHVSYADVCTEAIVKGQSLLRPKPKGCKLHACRSIDGTAPSVKLGDSILPTFAKPTDFAARKFKPLAGKSATDLQLVINVT